MAEEGGEDARGELSGEGDSWGKPKAAGCVPAATHAARRRRERRRQAARAALALVWKIMGERVPMRMVPK